MMVRHGFRTREGKGEERLPIGQCEKCKGETYRVPAGSWLHWCTLTTSCPEVLVAEQDSADSGHGLGSLSDGQEGAMS
jgi:hypothetical protein